MLLAWVWLNFVAVGLGLICIASVGVDLCCDGFGGSFVLQLQALAVVDLL